MQRELPVLISPSRAETSSRCHRRHMVANVLCYAEDEDDPPALAFGTAVHEAAAAWWEEREEAAAKKALEDAWDPSVEDNSDLTLELAQFMVRYYCVEASIAGDHWASDAPWELVACEDRIQLPIADGKAVLTFKVDRLVRCKDVDPPAYVLVDTKTSSRLTRWWRRLWPTSLQQKLYAAAVEEYYGVELDGHYIEGVLKSAPSDIEYLELSWPRAVREEALHTAATLARRDAELLALAHDGGERANADLLVELALTETLTNGDDCWSFGRKCELYELCHQTPPDMRAALLRAEFAHRVPEWLG